MKYLLSLLLIAVFAFPAHAEDLETRVKNLEDALKAKENSARASSGLFGGSALMNPNISLVLDTFFYGSSLSPSEIGEREISGYIREEFEHKKGFNLESAELFFFAPVDPYFNLYATIPVSEEEVELEEAFFVTTALPAGLQVKGGKFKSGFGRLNGQHRHQWDFADSPLPYRAFLGDEGLIEKGVQVTYLPTLPFYAELGFEALQGDNEVLFREDAATGPHAYAAFAKASLDLDDKSTLLFGPSVAFGKTDTGSIGENTAFEGDSTLWGLELTYKWTPSDKRAFKLQAEYLYRDQDGGLSEFDDDGNLLNIEGLERKQDGYYVQAVYRVDRWRLGARYDGLGLFKDKYILDGGSTDFGNDPWRATAAVEYNPSEFTRLRLQYNHDRSLSGGETNREVFLQAIFGIGAHAAHKF